jgi:hypothetical protein
MNEFMLGSLAAKKIEFSPLPSTSLVPPKEVVLTANDAVLADVQEAVRNFDKLVAAHHDRRVLENPGYISPLPTTGSFLTLCITPRCVDFMT